MDPFEEEETSVSGFDPKQMLRLFWRRKVLFFVPVIVCLTMAGVVIRFMAPIYHSSAQLRVIMNANVVSMLQDRSFGRARDQDHEALVTINTIVTGPKFLQSIVRELELQRGLTLSSDVDADNLSGDEAAAIRKAANSLRRQVRVSQTGTHLFEIRVRDPDPERAYILARKILDKFLEEERASRLKPTTQTRDFLVERRQRLVTQLAGSEDELARFQRTLLSQDLTANYVNELTIGNAEMERIRLSNQLEEDGAGELLRLERRAAGVLGKAPALSEITSSASIALVIRDLVTSEIDQLRGRITRELDNQATSGGSLRLRLNDLIAEKIDRIYSQQTFSEREILSEYLYAVAYRDVRVQALSRFSSAIEEFRAFRSSQPEQSATLVRLQEQVENSRGRVTAIDRQITQEDIRVEASMAEIGYQMVVRRDPVLPRRPSEPDKTKLGFMGFILSMGMGLGLVVLAIMFDRSLKTVAEIESATRLPVIGTLPIVSNPQFEVVKRRRILIWCTVIVCIIAIAAFGFLYVYPRLG